MGISSGPLFAIFAFILWGITPLFYYFLPNASAAELLSQRVIWSIPLLLLVRQLLPNKISWQQIWQDKRSLLFSLAASIAVGCSWTTFAYSLTHGYVLSASLGYFINPLISITLGVLVLRDKLTPFQRIAVLLAIAGLAYQIWRYGQLPGLALIMGTSFALYGLCRKFIRFDIITALLLETLWVLPIALGISIWLFYRGESVLISADDTTRLLYVLSAPVTLLPLLLFAAAIKKTSLTVVGLAQYIEPSLQFLLALWLFGEPFDDIKAVSFSLIWLGLLCCVFELLRQHWRYRNLPRKQTRKAAKKPKYSS